MKRGKHLSNFTGILEKLKNASKVILNSIYADNAKTALM